MFAIAASVGAVALAAAQPARDPWAEMHALHEALAEASAHLQHPQLLAVPRAGPPFMEEAWSANVLTRSFVGTIGGSKGLYFYDAPKQRARLISKASVTLFHESGDLMQMDQLTRNVTGFPTNITMGFGADATCKAMPTQYFDQFSLLRALGVHLGSGSVLGQPCEIWGANYSGMGTNIYTSACIGADGVPREFNMSTGMAYKAASMQSYIYYNVTVGAPDDSKFEPSEACAERYPAPACESTGTASLELYRVHSAAEPNVLANRNTGDALGDMAFFCDLGMDESVLVTKWSVQADSSWGQYAFCLYSAGKNTCYGHTGKHVGREGSMGFGGPVQGQCSENAELGSWFSLPADGECEEGAALGTDGCTWIAKSERTVTARCILEDRGLKDACAKERGHAPMNHAAEIFVAALASEDPAQGGCPNANAGDAGIIVV